MVIQDGLRKVSNIENIEGKCNLMVMEFLGPSLANLFMQIGNIVQCLFLIYRNCELNNKI